MRRLSWTGYCSNLDDNRKKATEIWMRMGTRRQSQWISFMLHELKERPRTALIPLDVALHNSELMPGRQILADCITMLAEYLLWQKANPLRMDVRMLHQFVCDYAIMNASFLANEPFRQKAIWLVLRRCDGSQLRSLFETILIHNLPLSSQTLLHFANMFMSSGQAHVGLELIRNTLKLAADPSSNAIQSSCVKLLRIPTERDDLYDYKDTAVTDLLRLGIRPKVILWTCIVQNAVEAGRYEAAWRWYNIGINDGLKPNRSTIFALFKMAKAQKDGDVLRSAIDEAHKAGVLPDDLEVVFDLLHAVLVIERFKATTEPLQESLFQSCLRHYVQYCEIEPLQELGCQLGAASEWQPRDRQLPAPSPRIIGMMVMAYIVRYGVREDLRDFFLRYQGLVRSEHPLIAPLANTDHVNNAFLMHFGNDELTLPFCTTVIKAMVQSTAFEASPSSNFRSITPNQKGLPTLQTWNILQRAYMKHGLVKAADKVRVMLESRGFTPDKITWTQSIAGYVGEQDVDKIIDAATAMNASGIEYDDVTIKYLQRITDKPRFFKAMEDREYQVYYGGHQSLQSRIENRTDEDFLENGSSARLDEELPLESKIRLDYTDESDDFGNDDGY